MVIDQSSLFGLLKEGRMVLRCDIMGPLIERDIHIECCLISRLDRSRKQIARVDITSPLYPKSTKDPRMGILMIPTPNPPELAKTANYLSMRGWGEQKHEFVRRVRAKEVEIPSSSHLACQAITIARDVLLFRGATFGGYSEALAVDQMLLRLNAFLRDQNREYARVVGTH